MRVYKTSMRHGYVSIGIYCILCEGRVGIIFEHKEQETLYWWSESKKDKIAYVAVSTFAAISISASTVLSLYISQRASESEMLVELRGQEATVQALSFESLPLFPGERCEYILNVEAQEKDEYTFTFEFRPKKTSGLGLEEVIQVAVYEQESKIVEQTLQEAFYGEPFMLTREMQEHERLTFTFRYTMSLEAGDAVQNAETDFDVFFLAKSI